MARRFGGDAAGWAGALAARMLLLGALWWALTEGEIGGGVLAAGAVLGAALVSLAAVPPGGGRWRIGGFLRFLPFFLRQSVEGGIDVAARAFHPRMPILPGTIDYEIRLPEGHARLFFVTVLSLLPGTLSARLRGGSLRVHLLHRGKPARPRLEELEARVAALFGADLGDAARS